jgi:hypothetical protein
MRSARSPDRQGGGRGGEKMGVREVLFIYMAKATREESGETQLRTEKCQVVLYDSYIDVGERKKSFLGNERVYI